MRACGTQILEDHEHSVRGLVFSPDGTLLASASDNRVRIWRVRDWESPPLGEEIERQAEPKAFSAVTFSSDGALSPRERTCGAFQIGSAFGLSKRELSSVTNRLILARWRARPFRRVRAFLAELIRVARKANKGGQEVRPKVKDRAKAAIAPRPSRASCPAGSWRS
jgi:WD domain, G-beta repeat